MYDYVLPSSGSIMAPVWCVCVCFTVVLLCYGISHNEHILTILGAQLLIILCTVDGLIILIHHILHSQTCWYGNCVGIEASSGIAQAGSSLSR